MIGRNQLVYLFMVALTAVADANTKPRIIPVYRAHGPRPSGGSSLRNVIDGREFWSSTGRIKDCYHSADSYPSPVEFQIPLSEIESVELVNHREKESAYPIYNLDTYGCRKTDGEESVCTRYGLVIWSGPGAKHGTKPPEGSIADEIRVVLNRTKGDSHITFCEIEIKGTILPAKKYPFSKELELIPIKGGVGPHALSVDGKNILQVFDKNLDRGKHCYVSNKRDFIKLKEVQLFFDQAMVTKVEILNGISKHRDLDKEIREFKVSVCKRYEEGRLVCDDCMGLQPSTREHWYQSTCEYIVGDEVHITRDIKHGDLSVDLWLCEVEITGRPGQKWD